MIRDVHQPSGLVGAPEQPIRLYVGVWDDARVYLLLERPLQRDGKPRPKTRYRRTRVGFISRHDAAVLLWEWRRTARWIAVHRPDRTTVIVCANPRGRLAATV